MRIKTWFGRPEFSRDGCVHRSLGFSISPPTPTLTVFSACLTTDNRKRHQTHLSFFLGPSIINRASGASLERFQPWYRTRSSPFEILARRAPSIRLYRSMTSSGVWASSCCGVCDEKGRHRQLGTSTNTTDRIQTCNGGFERDNRTKSGAFQPVLRLWNWLERPNHVVTRTSRTSQALTLSQPVY